MGLTVGCFPQREKCVVRPVFGPQIPVLERPFPAFFADDWSLACPRAEALAFAAVDLTCLMTARASRRVCLTPAIAALNSRSWRRFSVSRLFTITPDASKPKAAAAVQWCVQGLSKCGVQNSECGMESSNFFPRGKRSGATGPARARNGVQRACPLARIQGGGSPGL